jgi:hypothetical protein
MILPSFYVTLHVLGTGYSRMFDNCVGSVRPRYSFHKLYIGSSLNN